MVGLERLGRRPARDGVHHGRFHLKEAPVDQEIPYQSDNLHPLTESIPDLGVNNKIYVALPVSCFKLPSPCVSLALLLLPRIPNAGAWVCLSWGQSYFVFRSGL